MYCTRNYNLCLMYRFFSFQKLKNKNTVNAAVSKKMNSLGTQTLHDDKIEVAFALS